MTLQINRESDEPYFVLCDRWNESKYGTTSEESCNMRLIEYLKTKYLVHDSFETYGELIDYMYENRYLIFSQEASFRFMLVKREYVFADRYFALRHNGVIKFQKLWKKYYSDKLVRCKNVRRLMMRQITGKKIR